MTLNSNLWRLSIIGTSLASFLFVACGKVQTIDANDANQVPEKIAKSARTVAPARDEEPVSRLYPFEEGALSLDSATLTPSALATIAWDTYPGVFGSNEVSRYVMRVAETNQILASIRGDAKFSHANSIVLFKGPSGESWQGMVPFVLGRHYVSDFNYNFAIVTPDYRGGMQRASFIAPVGVDGTPVIDGFRARLENDRLFIYKDGESAPYARSLGIYPVASLVGLAVIPVRTGWTFDTEGKVASVYESIPFVLANHPTHGLSLHTRIGKTMLSPIVREIIF
jgi:hypothetical protein